VEKTNPSLPRSRIETEVQRIRELLDRSQFQPALAAAQALGREVPENRDVLHMVAVSQRCLGELPKALETLARFEKVYPGCSRLFQERGHCYVAAGNSAAAIDAYLAAVNLNAALPASWNALELLFRSAGQVANAESAAAHVIKLASLPTPVLAASNMLADGDIHAAEQLLCEFLRTHGDHIEAMRLLAHIGMKRGALDDAELLLDRVLAIVPDYHVARQDYIRVLMIQGKHAAALREAGTLLKIDPRNRQYRRLYAAASVPLGRYDSALRVYREMSAETPQVAELHLLAAHALRALGRQREAIDSYRGAALVSPGFGDAYWSLANLKTYRFAEEETSLMRREEAAATTNLVDRYHLCFALGKALEDRGEFCESFRYYERGNALKKSETLYEPSVLEREVRSQAAICTREFFEQRQGVGCDRREPIFIVGLPRAGSTLLEQILASHSQVEATMELPNISQLIRKLQARQYNELRPRYPTVLADLELDQLKRYGEQYLADTQVYRTGKPFFIDKMTSNFRHVGLIHLILPNAKIIDARREPMACCFSNFKQLFPPGQEFTYAIDDVARYYRMYVELMDHWKTVLPGRILKVQYEDVVENLESNVRRILDFCDLPFEPTCLEFYKTERGMQTASSEQVRQPIFKEGLAQWRNFEPWLGRLYDQLGDLAQAFASDKR
jgi:tetratricopeptide (TPR) repeat protein